MSDRLNYSVAVLDAQIEVLRDELRTLKRARRVLLQSSVRSSEDLTVSRLSVAPSKRVPDVSRITEKQTSIEKVNSMVCYLGEHGPTSANDLARITGYNYGSVYGSMCTYVNSSRYFKRTGDGKYTLSDMGVRYWEKIRPASIISLSEKKEAVS